MTLIGDRHTHNVSASILKRIPLDLLQACITSTKEEFVQVALDLASDISRLNNFRHAIRPAMLRSSFCDGSRFVEGLEAAYESVWQKWVQAHPSPSVDTPPSTASPTFEMTPRFSGLRISLYILFLIIFSLSSSFSSQGSGHLEDGMMIKGNSI